MKLTENRGLNEIANKELKIFVSEASKFKQVKSIVLYGSFSKGEGDIKKINNKIYYISDFDLILVGKNKLPKELLNKIKDNVTKRIKNHGIFNVKSFTINDFKNMPPFYKYYEMKTNAKILYGYNILNLIPKINPKFNVFSDLFTMFFDRVKLLMQYTPNNSSIENKLFCVHNINEFYKISIMCLLALENKLDFSHSQQQKIKLFNEIYENKLSNTISLIKDMEKLNYKNFKKDWLKARDHLYIILKYILYKKYNIKGNKWLDIFKNEFGPEYIKEYLPILSKNKIGIILNPPTFFVYPLQSYLTYSYNKKVGNPVYKNLLGKNYNFSNLYAGLIFMLFAYDNKNFLPKALISLKEIYPIHSYPLNEKELFEFLQSKYLEAYNKFLGQAKF